MLPKIKQHNNNIQNISPEIKEELDKEKILAEISNQAAEKYGDLLNTSNEANQTHARKKPKYQGMSEKNYIYDDEDEDEKDNSLDISLGENRNQIIEENGSENGDEESEDEVEKLIREAREALAERENTGQDETDEGPDVLNTGFYDKLPMGEEKKPKKGKKPAKKKEKKSSKKSGPAKKEGRQKKEEDLTQIEKSLEPIEELGVDVQKMDPREKPSGAKKFLSSLAYYSGKFLGKIFGSILTLLNTVTGGVFSGSHSGLGTWRRLFGQSFTQEKKSRKNIPGWDGAQFEERPQNDDEVSIDFRRVPDVWSYPIAVEGDTTEGEGDKAERKQRPPVISVYVAQSSTRYTADDTYTSGHSGIGIEYSRRSAKTGRWERYNLRYGFGMGGGMGGHALNATLSYNNATVPGELRNEKDLVYSVSRSYTATPKQVNDVLRASETYADKGGYNQYTRNCTTFAKEMVVDVAKIRGAAPIFERDEVYAHSKADAAMFGAGFLAPYYKAEMQNKFARMNTKDDMTYQGFGNKLISKEDYKRYKKSIGYWSGRKDRTDSPNSAAGNMYRMEGSRSGKMGAGLNAFLPDGEVRTAPMDDVKIQLPKKVTRLRQVLENITPDGGLTDEKMSAEFKNVIDSLKADKIQTALESMPMEEDELNQTKQTDLIRYRSVFTNIVDNCNTLLFKYYHNDKRVQENVLEIFDWASHGIRNIDEAYANTSNKDNEDPEKGLENLKINFSKQNYKINYSDNDGVTHTVIMTPSHYESYLQIYKTPEKAIKNFARYAKLYSQYWNHHAFGKNDPRFREFEKLERIDQLADDFDKSHKYMLDKAEYSQEDIDYAFSLYKKEDQRGLTFYQMNKNGRNNPYNNAPVDHSQASASNVYQMLILKTIFGDMKTRFDQHFKNLKATKIDVVNWFDADIAGKIDEKNDGMKMVLRGIKKSIKDPDKRKIRRETADLLKRWMAQMSRGVINQRAVDSIAAAVTSDGSQVSDRISVLIDDILSEGQQEAEQ